MIWVSKAGIESKVGGQMYFAVLKLTFETEPGHEADLQALRSLTEKLRSRFKVCAAVCTADAGATSLAITALGSSEERLSQTLDKVSVCCEEAGLGRIASEDALLDHIDNIAEFTSSSEHD